MERQCHGLAVSSFIRACTFLDVLVCVLNLLAKQNRIEKFLVILLPDC